MDRVAGPVGRGVPAGVDGVAEPGRGVDPAVAAVGRGFDAAVCGVCPPDCEFCWFRKQHTHTLFSKFCLVDNSSG